ncbi:beta-ketoacyl synthase [Chitinophaga pendula]|uniref:beta-ketoacyl-[acyl-carrier-protein] synthase family protein n=1 Tax=Chitinophaga TaxID=79328 RepID=UPI000BAF09A3|nr:MULTISPECIES: beta-ketoacyl synthase N-terminal-like domain-containing protein [Chitinophaga]ASZ11461.1 beta-ketoacyl synthase [Chitinophaga sp. MD30]UCJ05529.1 beta-ketoacyl synthase [Chitinophaga pendula]
MKKVYAVADNIVSALGNTSGDNFRQVVAGHSGIRLQEDNDMSAGPFQAAMLSAAQLLQYSTGHSLDGYTKFEQLIILSVQDALSHTNINLGDERTAFIISTTKGNIERIEQQYPQQPPMEQLELYASAQRIAGHLGYLQRPIVVSNACISGLLAILIGQRLIASGQYDRAVVTGADVMTQFVLSGFQSFQAVSAAPCRPFDAGRNGVTLGEAAATVILSTDPAQALTQPAILTGGGAVSNDANHISGPSRTGAELATAMRQAMERSGLEAADIGFVSAHGTATVYNDEMEAKALNIAGLQHTPVNSLKGYYGHTLGAAGLVEAIISMHAMTAGLILPTKGFEQLGVTQPVNVCSTLQRQPVKHFLKTVSGFGGCNAAMIFSVA